MNSFFNIKGEKNTAENLAVSDFILNTHAHARRSLLNSYPQYTVTPIFIGFYSKKSRLYCFFYALFTTIFVSINIQFSTFNFNF